MRVVLVGRWLLSAAVSGVSAATDLRDIDLFPTEAALGDFRLRELLFV